MVLLKLSKSQPNQASKNHEKQANNQTNIQPNNQSNIQPNEQPNEQPNYPKTQSAVPPQAAKVFASLDLNLGPTTKAVDPEKTEALPSAETLRVRLNLAKAYLTIEDFKAARLALNEILSVSTLVDPEITIQAQSLLAQIDQRKI
jgi:pilus assembly protein FimV